MSVLSGITVFARGSARSSACPMLVNDAPYQEELVQRHIDPKTSRAASA
jgi:hypothetical protein